MMSFEKNISQKNENREILLQNIQGVLEAIDGLQNNPEVGDNFSPFEISEVSHRGKDVIKVKAGKNVFFEINKSTIEQLKNGTLPDNIDLSVLTREISRAKRNIKEVLEFIKE